MSPPQPNSASAVAPAQEFSSEERSQLLRLAHDSISSALEHREISLEPPTPHFAEPRGVFTSIYLRRDEPGRDRHEEALRGCVGYVFPTCPVYRAVGETARAAAFDDSRFPPVTREEALHLAIELSILSPAQAILPEEIEIGRHGLLISWHGRRGLLLPQVPVEHAWDRTAFLEQTCRKAGLPPDAWQKGATIEGFTAEVFGEKSGK
ncbi:MAG: AmmeMemoRadiSam system protein A [Candidatus Sulfotelmatobacter sp.]